MVQSNTLKFKTHMYRHMNKTQQTFQPWPWLMTSSRRHFVNVLKNYSWSYFHNGTSFLIHIYHDQGQYQSSQFQVKKRARARTSARQCARKMFKCSKSSQIYFAYVSGHFKHFIKNRAYEHARAFSRVTPLKNTESPFFFLSWYFSYFFKEFDSMFISLWPLLTRWA